MCAETFEPSVLSGWSKHLLERARALQGNNAFANCHLVCRVNRLWWWEGWLIELLLFIKLNHQREKDLLHCFVNQLVIDGSSTTQSARSCRQKLKPEADLCNSFDRGLISSAHRWMDHSLIWWKGTVTSQPNNLELDEKLIFKSHWQCCTKQQLRLLSHIFKLF